MVKGEVTVLTSAIPHRVHMLSECIESVMHQTKKPYAHHIGIDYSKVGCGAMMNRMAKDVKTEWIAFLADDDIFYPNHLEVLLNATKDSEARMIYPWCNVKGNSWGPNWSPNSLYDPMRLKQGNYIPGTVLFSTETFHDLGCFDETPFEKEDFNLWIKLITKYGDAAIKCVPVITWEYRFHGENTSVNNWRPL